MPGTGERAHDVWPPGRPELGGRIGAFRTVVIGEAAGLTGFALLFFFGHFSLRGVGPVAWLLLLAGAVGVVGYLTLYRRLESGHVGLVSAISASYGGIIAVLSVLLRERMARLQAGGAVLILAGLVLLGAGS
jgi:uncharacterized membrane protein